MCNPFFHQLRVIPSAYGFQLVCYTAPLVTTELYAWALTLLTLSGLEGQWAMIYLVMEAWKSRLLGLSCETLLILTSAAIFYRKLHYSHDHQSNMNGMQGQNSRVPLPSLWCSLCHLYICCTIPGAALIFEAFILLISLWKISRKVIFNSYKGRWYFFWG